MASKSHAIILKIVFINKISIVPAIIIKSKEKKIIVDPLGFSFPFEVTLKSSPLQTLSPSGFPHLLKL